jgi:hypothetical protein
MTKTGTEYRQQVADFRGRLRDFAQGKVPAGDRPKIDPQGRLTSSVPSRTDAERFSIYGRRRLNSIARVMALFELMRDLESLPTRGKPVEVEAQGAFWQAFPGTTASPACHTCPALLMLDGQYPTLLTSNLGLRRHLIVAFADCMKMPVLVNKVDRQLDDKAGWQAFEQAGRRVLNMAGVSWQHGVDTYREGMRDMFPEMLAIIERDVIFDDHEVQSQFEACQAFYQGLFLTAVNAGEMRGFVAEVRAEMGRS